jgi:hypothetical protein
MSVMRLRSLRFIVVVLTVVGMGCTSSGRGAATPTNSTALAAAPASSEQQPASCRAGELKLDVGPDFGAAGTEHQYFSLTNTASRSCTLNGYPGVTFVASDGRVVADNFERASDPPPSAVAVAPGNTASFQVNYGGGGVGCQREVSWTTVRVIPPNDTGVLSAPFKDSACGGYTVHAVQAGPPPQANG